VGTVNTPPPVQFFASIIFRDSGILSTVGAQLAEEIAPIQEKTEIIPFSQSAYYCPEMGDGLQRCFVLFVPLSERDGLADVKLRTNHIEGFHSAKNRRSVNIDPGYIALEQVVLATTKGYTHRIYLGKGIFADLTLVFENGTYRKLPWTYPDYGSEELISLLNRWRERYKRLLRWQRA
jgi:Domain of unknown function (DUF4416)